MASDKIVMSPFYMIASVNGGDAGNPSAGSYWEDTFGTDEENQGLWLLRIRFHWDTDKVRIVPS